MPQTTPKYVRMTDHMLLGCQVDLNTGWGISGRDVKEVPEDPSIQAYVRTGINRGIFEEASRAEYDEVQESVFNPYGDDTPKVIMIDPSKPIPENVLQQLVAQHSGVIEERVAARQAQRLHVDESTPADAYQRLGEQTLRSELSARGMASSGTRAELISRLQASDGSGYQPEDLTVSDPEPPAKGYDEMSKKELIAAAKAKRLPTNGSVDDLVERLEASEAN